MAINLTLKNMVEDRAAVGKRALGSWLGRCSREIGEVSSRVARLPAFASIGVCERVWLR